MSDINPQHTKIYIDQLHLSNMSMFGSSAKLFFAGNTRNWKQWTVILGDNGTGKTTLLRLLAGFEMFEVQDDDLS